MLILKSVKLVNFLSHSNNTIEFEANERLLITGNSGSGKSSIVESIIWCLYGKGRSDNRSMVKNGKEKAVVTLKLVDNDKNGNVIKYYNIERTANNKGRQSVSIAESEDGARFSPSAVGGVMDAQKWLEKTLLKASYQLFINSVAYPQENIENFVKQPANKRKDLLLEIASVDDYEAYYLSAREKLSSEKIDLASREASIEGKLHYIRENKAISDQVGELTAEEATLKAIVEKLELQQKEYDERKSGIDTLMNALQLSRVDVRRVQDKLNTLTESRIAKRKKIELLEGIDKTAIEAGVKEYNVQVAIISGLELIEKANYEIQLKRSALLASKPQEYNYEDDILNLIKQKNDALGDKNAYCEFINKNCPTLEKKTQVNIAYFDQQIVDKQSKAAVLKTELEKYEKALQELPAKFEEEETRVRLSAARKSRDDNFKYVGEFNILAHQEAMVKELEAEIEAIEMDGTLLTMEAEEIRAKEAVNLDLVEQAQKNLEGLSPKTQMISNAKEDLYNVTVKLSRAVMAKELKEKMEKEAEEILASVLPARERIKQLELVKDAFSQHGIKTVVIEYLLPRLEDKVNEILGQLSEFTVCLDTQKNKADGESVIEGLFISIKNAQNEQLDFANYSGSEKLRISYSISEALATLQKCNFRILDEVVHGLDQENEKKFVDALSVLHNNVSQVLCITHLQSVKDLFEKKITVTKINDNSTVI